MPDQPQMIKRQKVLADFGEFALRSQDLDEVLTEACRLVGEALGTGVAKVLEIEEDKQRALVRAGIGWKSGIVGQERVSLEEHSSEAHAIEQGRPIITKDIEQEKRFAFPEFLKKNGVKALVNVPIFLPGGRAYGLLQVDAREPRDFGQEDIEFLRTYATILGPVIDRLHKVQHLQVALDDNKRLLQELQHRVRNHIGIVASLIRMRARSAATDDARQELLAVGERVEALRICHEHLSETGTATKVQIRPYVTQLAENLCSLYEQQSGQVRLEIDVEEVDLGPDKAVPLGLIMNEFLTNSLKYAFGDTGGVIRIRIAATDESFFEIRMSDNGKGLPKASRPAESGSGMGVKLIEGLAGQIGAKPHWSAPGESGTKLSIVFSKS